MLLTFLGFLFACVVAFQLWIWWLSREARSQNSKFAKANRTKLIVYTCPETKQLILQAIWKQIDNFEVVAVVQINSPSYFWQELWALLKVSRSLSLFHLYSYFSSDFLMYVANRIRPSPFSFISPTIPVPFDLRKDTYDRSQFLLHLKNLKDIRETICVSFAGPLLPKEVLNMHRLCLNAHAGILPQNKGSYPEFWSCLKSDISTGYSIHEMIVAIDAGALVKSEVVSDLSPHYFEMYVQLRVKIANAFVNFLATIPEDSTIKRSPQKLMRGQPSPSQEHIESAMKLAKFSFNPLMLSRNFVRIMFP